MQLRLKQLISNVLYGLDKQYGVCTDVPMTNSQVADTLQLPNHMVGPVGPAPGVRPMRPTQPGQVRMLHMQAGHM